jgi:hypothetical protein
MLLVPLQLAAVPEDSVLAVWLVLSPKPSRLYWRRPRKLPDRWLRALRHPHDGTGAVAVADAKVS